MNRVPRDYSGLDFDFALGEVYGLRVWKVDAYGRLRARYVDVAPPWRPGINTATCFNALASVHASMRSFLVVAGLLAADPGPPPPEESTTGDADAPVLIPNEKCECGFYAYTSPALETFADQPDTVLGVIRGTGRTLVGTKGFRCEKAEIVALLDPASADRPAAWASWQGRQIRRVYPDVPLLASREELLRFAPITGAQIPDPSTDDFWSLP